MFANFPMLKEEWSINFTASKSLNTSTCRPENNFKITQNQGQILLLHSHLFSNPSEERQIYPMQYRRAQTTMDADSSYNMHL